MRWKKKNELYRIRHSSAHLLAHALTELYPEVQLTHGPATENGFFYDFYLPTRIKESDLPAIEKRMHHIAQQALPITGQTISQDEALKRYKNNPFKTEIIHDIGNDEAITIYTQGSFSDLCEGGHVANTSELKHFHLTGLAGSYWRGDKNREQLQRISGVAFKTAQELERYLTMIEEAKKYDHRLLGKQLDLFSFHEEAAGMPFFHDKGLRIFNLLIDHARRLQQEDGYREIQTPLVLKRSLWEQSGHFENYKENMYFATVEKDEEELAIKPMNCPPGILIYKQRPHSYREFPLRVAEFGICHRYELSGVLHGLMRVRAFTMDDAHIFCTREQIAAEVAGVLTLAENIYRPFGFTNIRMAISTMPPKRIGSDQLWHEATDALKAALTARGQDFVINEGEGAFYGPKIEILLEDTMGREWQCGTVQIDFFLPQRFELEYIAADQSRQTPVMIHRAIYGSLERFMGILTEHFKGRFPFWLAPVQARIMPISEKQIAYAKMIEKRVHQSGLRVETDSSGDKISAQIRRAQLEHIPWMLIVGAHEEDAQTVTLRTREGTQEAGVTLEALAQRIDVEMRAQ
jgi:threonyl-tRNA synthetase